MKQFKTGLLALFLSGFALVFRYFYFGLSPHFDFEKLAKPNLNDAVLLVLYAVFAFGILQFLIGFFVLLTGKTGEEDEKL